MLLSARAVRRAGWPHRAREGRQAPAGRRNLRGGRSEAWKELAVVLELLVATGIWRLRGGRGHAAGTSDSAPRRCAIG